MSRLPRAVRWRPRSIRRRILAAVLLAMTLVLAGGAVSTTWALRSYLDDRATRRLETVGERVTQTLALNVANHGGMQINEQQLDALLGDHGGMILVVDDEPALSIGLPDVPATRLIEATRDTTGQVRFVRGTEAAAAIQIPTKGLSVTLEGTNRAVDVDSVVLALSREDDRLTVLRLVRIGVLVAVAGLLLCALLVVVIVRTGLRPLTDLADAVQAVGRGERGPQSLPTSASSETAEVALAVREAFVARARAEDRLRSFVADASHELRTPLTKIGGWVDLYLQGGLPGEQGTQAAMEKVEAEVGRMGLLVEELSLLARLDAQVPLDLADLDLPGIVALAGEVLDDARVVADDRSFRLLAQVGESAAGPAEDLGRAPVERTASAVPARRPSGGRPGEPGWPPVVRADAERLRRVLRNLVGNAVQHTPAGTAVEVTVAARGPDTDDDPGAIVIEVRDHGAGIPADHLPKLFERFWRAEESRTRARGGSGLGLAIVEAVVVAHGGSVDVRSRVDPDPQHGTTVTITLPARAARPGSDAAGAAPMAGAVPEEPVS